MPYKSDSAPRFDGVTRQCPLIRGESLKSEQVKTRFVNEHNLLNPCKCSLFRRKIIQGLNLDFLKLSISILFIFFHYENGRWT